MKKLNSWSTSGERILLYFNYAQKFDNSPFVPSLWVVSFITSESKACQSPHSCTRLEPNEKVDNITIQIIIDALVDRIQTVYRRFSELNYQDIPQDVFITALNTCTGIDDGLDTIIEQEKAKF